MKPTSIIVAVLTAALVVAPAKAQRVAAKNDPAAIYQDGVFTLPETLTTTQYYIIVIEQEGAKDTELKLPDGTNLTRLVHAARPTGAWTWSYRLRPINGLTITTTTPTDRFKAGIKDLITVAPDKRSLPIEWKHLPEANKYRIVTQDIVKPPRGPEKPPGKDNAPLAVYPIDELQAEIAPKSLETIPFQIPVTPGQSFLWRVEAQDEKGYVISSSKPSRVDVEDPWYSELAKSGFKLQRSESLTVKELRKTDALLSFSQTSSEAKPGAAATQDLRSFSTEFAVLWRAPDNLLNVGTSQLFPSLSIEARLNSSGSAKANDVIRGRVGLAYTLDRPPVDSVANVKWEHDRKTKVDKTMLEFVITPLGGPFGQLFPPYGPDRTNIRGNVIPGKEYPIQFGITPSIGLDYGRTSKKLQDGIEREDVLRYVGLVRIDMEVPMLARVLQIARVSAWTDMTTRYLKHENGDRRKDFVSSSLDFWVAPNVAVSTTYKVGRDAPAFGWGRNFGLGISGRFN